MHYTTQPDQQIGHCLQPVRDPQRYSPLITIPPGHEQLSSHPNEIPPALKESTPAVNRKSGTLRLGLARGDILKDLRRTPLPRTGLLDQN